MSPESSTPNSLAPELDRLHPYIATLLELATHRARRLHAVSVSVEHLIGAAMDDEECAAYSAVEHAFADPETLSQEMLALSTGIMVVGSGAALPFSVLALESLRAARAASSATRTDAPENPEKTVDCALIFEHAVRSLPSAAREALVAAGCSVTGAAAESRPSDEDAQGFFACFTDDAKRALSRANKRSSLASEPSIGPARLILACLEEADLSERFGIPHHRARQALHGMTRDETPIPSRDVPPDAELVRFLKALPPGAGSLALILECQGERGTPEMAELMRRHMITPALLERSLEAFQDPAG